MDRSEIEALERVAERFSVAITPDLVDLVTPGDPNDPIARQFVPSKRELRILPEERVDPIGDDPHTPVKGITHRYPDRLLLKPVHVCPAYCRFCFRREKVGPGSEVLSREELTAAITYIRAHEEVWEVILSGGDPLILPPRKLAEITAALSTIEHVRVLRVHTRVPVMEPGRVDEAMVQALRAPNLTTYVVLHTNHPQELGPKAREAIARLVDAGIPMLSQTVLLRGVNADAETLKALFRESWFYGSNPITCTTATSRWGRGISGRASRRGNRSCANSGRVCPESRSRRTCWISPAGTGRCRSGQGIWGRRTRTGGGRWRIRGGGGMCIRRGRGLDSVAKRGRGAWAAMVLGALAVPVIALVLLREHPSPSRVEHLDRMVNEGPTNVPVDASWDASDEEDVAETCTETETLKAVVNGSYRSTHLPSLSIGSVTVRLSEPHFAKALSAGELCSTETSSPSHLRIVCLGKGGEPTTIEVRVEDNGRTLGGSIDGVPQSFRHYEQPDESGRCLALETAIPKRDLTGLQAAFLDDGPSERCRKGSAPRRKVSVSFEGIPLPRNHESPSSGYANTPKWEGVSGSVATCRSRGSGSRSARRRPWISTNSRTNATCAAPSATGSRTARRSRALRRRASRACSFTSSGTTSITRTAIASVGCRSRAASRSISG